MSDRPGELVGQIRPDPANGNQPLFRILRRSDSLTGVLPVDDMAGVRPCDHLRFILDEKWSTVTCEDCRANVDPFQAIMRYASWFERLKTERMLADMAERRVLAASLRAIKDRKALTPEEADEIKKAGYEHAPLSTKEMRDTLRKYERVLGERRRAKREAKRVGSPVPPQGER